MKVNLYGRGGKEGVGGGGGTHGFTQRLILTQKQKATGNGQLFLLYYKLHEQQITRLKYHLTLSALGK